MFKTMRIFASLLVLNIIFFNSSLYASEFDCEQIVDERYCANIEWIQGPFIDASSESIVSIEDIKTGLPVVLGDKIEFKTWMIMEHHSHGGSPVLVSQNQPGKYRIRNIYFFSGMKGVWQLNLIYNKGHYTLYEIEL